MTSTTNTSTESDSSWSLKHPYAACLALRRPLTTGASAKNVQHLEIDIAGSGLTWLPGDSLGALATNDPQLVTAVISAAQLQDDQLVNAEGQALRLNEALSQREISRIPKAFVSLVAERSGAADLAALLEPANRAQLTAYTSGRDMLDILVELNGLTLLAQELVDCLRPIPPRLYSIASSQANDPQHIHLAVSVVTWESHGRVRNGVASTWLGERVTTSDALPCYVHAAKKFRLPSNPETPIIMIGPGTGIAPFRAFLQQRVADQASGANWLFFGEQHRASDFLYGDELTAWQQSGALAELDLAFSRDQADKVYVQHLMWERRTEVWQWLERGAHLYVCGDALRMAKDVDDTLQRIAHECGGFDDDTTQTWIKALKKDGRYQRDVYAI